jgi:hypothetical protein
MLKHYVPLSQVYSGLLNGNGACSGQHNHPGNKETEEASGIKTIEYQVNFEMNYG